MRAVNRYKDMITIKDALAQSVEQSISEEEQRTSRLDAQLLLSSILGVERAMLFAYPERTLTDEQAQRFFALMNRRKQGEPLAYLLGHKEFYGLDFVVDERVLIPRPETELLVEAALHTIRERLARGETVLVADIGTGSAAIPIALAVEEPRLAYLYASDISADALTVARLNCERHSVEQRIHLLQGDLLAPLPEPVDVLTANLPYVGTDELPTLAPDVVAYEPHLALFSGPKGLGLLYRFLVEAQQFCTLKAGGMMLLEIGYQQGEQVLQYVHELWPNATAAVTRDYAGWDRLLQIYL